MTIREFEKVLGRQLVMESSGPGWRCYFPGVMFAAPEGQSDVDLSIIGGGPNQTRTLEDFVQKIRGKVARIYRAGVRSEFPVPHNLRP